MIRQIKQHSNQQPRQLSPQANGESKDNREKSLYSLTDADYEFLFNQLLEGVAHGWHSVKIAKFFQRLGERGQQQLWVAWLERYGEKLLASSSTPQQQLGARMIRLGEITQSTSSVKQIGIVAYNLGKQILYGRNPNLIWEYNGADLPLASEESTAAEVEAHQAVVANEAPTEEQNNSSSSSFADAANWIQDAIAEFVALAEQEADQSGAAESETENDSEELSSPETAELSEPPAQPSEELSSPETAELSEPPAQPSEELSSPTTAELSEPLPQTSNELSVAHSVEIQKEENLVEKESNLVKATNIKPSPLEDESAINLSWQQFVELIQKDDNLVQQIAQQFNLTDRDPQSIIQAVSNQLNLVESTSIDESTLELVESWFNLGLKQASTGDLNGAIVSWNKALELNPNLAEAWHNRGSALGRLGNYEEALESFEQALKIDADSTQAWNDRAHALYQLGKLPEAIASWEQAIAIVPGNYQFWYNRGCALEELQQKQQAIASYEKALEIKPDFQLARSRYINLLGDRYSIN